MSTQEEPSDRPLTPPRRSIYDLEDQVNEIFDGLEAKDIIINDDSSSFSSSTTTNSSRACRAKALPDLFRKFSEKSGKHFLDPDEIDLVVQFAHANEDVIVTSDILMNFLSRVLSRDGADQYESPPARRERHEKRVYKSSPSSTEDLELPSQQESGNINNPSLTTPRTEGLPSDIITSSQTVFHTPYTENIYKNDAATYNGAPPSPISPLAVRQRTSPLERQPPQPQRPASIRNAKHRRKSEEHFWNHHYDTSLDSSFENSSSISSPSSRLSNISADQFSTPTISSATPSSSKAATRARMRHHAAASQRLRDERVSSPPPQSSQDSSNILSPKVDATSYYPTPEELSLEDPEQYNKDDERPREIFKTDSDESLRLIARASSEFLGESFGEAFAGSGGLSFNIESLASLATLNEHDVALLIRSAQELSKRLKEQERINIVAAESSEATIADLQTRIEDIQNELGMKRKDEKELRQKERQYLIQINALEQEVTQLGRSLEKQRDLYSGLRKQYEEQCQESEKLRDTIRFKEQEAAIADEVAQTHAQEYAKWERERSFLEGSIARLEREISVMRAAEDALDEQRQQNMELKETIDRLRFDLDGLRTHAKALENAKSGSLGDSSGGAGSANGSLPGSMSRNLGREIAQQLNDIRKNEEFQGREGEEISEEELEEGESHDDSIDKYIEQVFVTRTRRIKVRDGSISKEPIIQHIETTDAEAQCDPVLTKSASIQTAVDVAVGTEVSYPSRPDVAEAKLNPSNKKEKAESGVGTTDAIVDKVPVKKSSPEELMAQRQTELAKSLGLDLEAIKKYVKSLAEEKRQNESESSASAKPIEPPPPYSTVRQPSTWTSAVPEAASTIINIIHPGSGNSNNNGVNGGLNPSSIQYYLQSPAATVALCSIVAYLTGVLSVSMYSSRHYHYFATPLGMGASDRAMWNAYNSAALEGLGFANSATHGGGFRDAAVFWLKRVIWTGVNVALRVPT